MNDRPSNGMRIVYAITERGERTYWTRIGVAFTNRDGSISIKLDAIPVSGQMQLRSADPRDPDEAQTGRAEPASSS